MFHYERSRECKKIIDEIVSDGQISYAKEVALKTNRKRFQITSRIANHQVWIILHIILVVLGFMLIMISMN